MASSFKLKNLQDQEFSITHPDGAGAISINSNNIATKDSSQVLHLTDALSILDNTITLNKGDGTNESITIPSTNVAIAELGEGSIGTYAFCYKPTPAALAFGSTVAGSSILPASTASGIISSVLTGTWRLMGANRGTSDERNIYLRIA